MLGLGTFCSLNARQYYGTRVSAGSLVPLSL